MIATATKGLRFLLLDRGPSILCTRNISKSPSIRCMMSTSTVCLDGTTLEGGGQLLRLALSLSSLTHIPIRVTDIRGKRGPLSAPTQGGGLKGSHLSAVRWLACTTDALMSGAEVGVFA